MTGNKKLQVWYPLLFSLVLIAGMFLGFKLGDRAGNGKGLFAGNKRSSLQEAMDLINAHEYGNGTCIFTPYRT